MANVKELGYIGIEASDLAGWEAFGVGVRGLQLAEKDAERLVFRIDDRAHRITVTAGPADDLVHQGYAGLDGATLDELSAALALLEPLLKAVTRDVAALQSELDVMRALEINGRVEAASAADAGAVVTLFRTIGEQIATARETIARFAAVTRLDFRRAAAEAAEMHRQSERMREALASDERAPRADAAA